MREQDIVVTLSISVILLSFYIWRFLSHPSSILGLFLSCATCSLLLPIVLMSFLLHALSMDISLLFARAICSVAFFAINRRHHSSDLQS